jgi:hypothetical protein
MACCAADGSIREWKLMFGRKGGCMACYAANGSIREWKMVFGKKGGNFEV